MSTSRSELPRRHALRSLAGWVTGALLASKTTFAQSEAPAPYRMPDEGETHACTWMAFGASKAVWGGKLLAEVQRNLATIALTISRYEPVVMLVRPEEKALAEQLMGAKVQLLPCPLDDLWMRDSGPVFVHTAQQTTAYIDFNFNGWGNKQAHAQDAKVAAVVAQHAHTKRITTRLVVEGGGIEVDGQGTAIITESCVLNANRNPGLGKAECEKELNRLLGIRKVIWLPGIKGKDITDGHTDFYARFARPGVVVAGFDPDPQSFDHAITQKHLALLRAARDAHGRPLEVVVLEAPARTRPKFRNAEFAAGYINFYVCNGAVIAPEFGDTKADKAAYQTLQDLFPERDVVQLNIDGIAAGGGGIHCTTQQQPKAIAL
jgi:agmatine deiminase